MSWRQAAVRHIVRRASEGLGLADAVVFHQRHADHGAHFEQPRPGARADVLGQRAAVLHSNRPPLHHGAAGVAVGQVGGGNQGLPLVAAVGDDASHGVLHPAGDAVRAQVVEQQDVGVERRAVGLAVGGIRRLVVAGLDAVEQRLVVVEQAVEALLDDLAKRRHRQVRFAGPRLADEQQARPRLVGEIADVVFHRQQNGGQFLARDGVLGAHTEVVERSLAVQGRDLGALFQPLGAMLRPAVARPGAGERGALHDDEPRAATIRTNRLRDLASIILRCERRRVAPAQVERIPR